ncbi:MAG: hypothetical protein CVT89_04085 [Candidatus Altiarchaeales archaeon HGW-Altiarchaeales-2]|nr:MAG: hypothetical protein CVT89_04085 [Candidatus Altiarchaeales archaeon HGW-Altiarchaeales-2]
MINPFSYSHPADPKYFVNRENHLEFFIKAIKNSAKIKPYSPENFIILGDWGYGKTSLLRKMEEIVLKELTPEIKVFSFYFTLTPEICKSWDTFCFSFLTELKDKHKFSSGISIIKSKIQDKVLKWKISSISVGFNPSVSIKKEENKEGNISLEDNLEDLWKKHLEPSGIDICVLFLDDIQYFLQERQSNPFFTIRNTFQELARRECNFSLVMTGPKTLFENADMVDPFRRFFRQFYLEPLTIEATKDAINKRIEIQKLNLEFSDDVILEIYKKSDGHPYYIMVIAYEIVNLIGDKGKLTKEDFNNLWLKIIPILEEDMASRLVGVSEKEKECLIKMSLIDNSVSPSMLKEIKGSTTILSRLEEKRLIVKRERGKYEVFHPLFKEYLRKLKQTQV